MKKILLGSTAVLGFAMIASQAQAELDLSFGAEVNVYGGVVADDWDFATPIGGNERDYGIVNEAEFDIMLDGRADNGLLYGASMTIEASGGNAEFDESFLYVGGGWGEVRAGNHDSAAHAFRITLPDAGSGIADGDYGEFAATGLPGTPGTGYVAGGNKISYHGQFDDFGFGISFTPVTSGGSGTGANMNTRAVGEDVLSAGARYRGDFGGASVGVSAGIQYGVSESEDVSFAALSPGTGNTAERLFQWGLGAEVGFGGFTFGGFYVNDGDSGYDENATDTNDRWRAGLGLGYEMGALNVAVNGMYEEGDHDGQGTWNTWAAGIGADYALAPGLTTYGDITYFEWDDKRGLDNDGVVFLVGTTVNF